MGPFKSIAVLSLLLASSLSYPQKVGSYYTVKSTILLNPVDQNKFANLGNTKPADVQPGFLYSSPINSTTLLAGTRLKIIQVIGSPKIVIVEATYLPPTDSNPSHIQFYEVDNFDGIANGLIGRTNVDVEHTLISVPFRFQLKASSVQQGGMLGDFISFTPLRFDALHLGPFLGVTAISGSSLTNQPSAGTTGLFGLTYGFGFMIDVPKSNLQAGILLGFDHVNGGVSSYQYTDRAWISFSLGYKFTS